MKVIDKTPLIDEKGSLGLLRRVQAAMEFGFSWQAEVEAQKPVIAQLERVLEKGYTLIRNLSLENSKIIEPLILVGPAGVFVLHVTPVTGFFEAKGDEWNIVRRDQRRPASNNPMIRVARLSRALQVYLNRQGVILPCVVEGVLIAGNPAVHIDVLRPIVRVVLSDAVKQWAASLLQARPVLRTEAVFDVVDRLQNPRSKPPPLVAQPAPAATPPTTAAAVPAPTPSEPAQRARVIFHAAEEAKPFDPADLDFEFDEKASNDAPGELAEKTPSPQAVGATPGQGLSSRQWIVLVVMGMLECTVLAAFLYLILFGSA